MSVRHDFCTSLIDYKPGFKVEGRPVAMLGLMIVPKTIKREVKLEVVVIKLILFTLGVNKLGKISDCVMIVGGNRTCSLIIKHLR